MKSRLAATVGLLAALSACSSGIQTTQDYSPDFSFAQIQTWDWMPEPPRTGAANPRADNDFVRTRLRNAIEATMEDKGFQKVDGGDPDVRVGFHLALDEGVDYRTLNTYYGGGWGYGMYRYPYGGMGMSSTTVQERRYTVGTLIIDVFDVASQQLVWRGAGEGRLKDPTTDPVERQRRADDAVWEIMRPFPPGR